MVSRGRPRRERERDRERGRERESLKEPCRTWSLSGQSSTPTMRSGFFSTVLSVRARVGRLSCHCSSSRGLCVQGCCEEPESGAARVREISPFQFDEGVRRHVQAQDQWLRERVLVKIEDKRLCKVSFITTNTRIRFGEACVYYLRNRSIHWNV